MKYHELVNELKKRGCIECRSTGKHTIFRHPNLPRNIVIPKKHGDVRKGIYWQCNSLLSSVGA